VRAARAARAIVVRRSVFVMSVVSSE
jgi:hypothetical protein